MAALAVDRPLTNAVRTLDEGSLAAAALELAGRDRDLAMLFERDGVPPLWPRPPGFATLVRLILEQQVSLASARAAYGRLETRLGVLEPDALLGLGDDEMRAVGFSRQKAGYVRGLAEAIRSDRLVPAELTNLPDHEVRRRLLEVRGVGPWTADSYLLFALLRADAWPSGDRALYVAIAAAKRLDDVPPASAADTVAGEWRPWRAVAARMLWHHYLSDGFSWTGSG